MQVNIQNEESQTINSPRYRFNQSPKFVNNNASTLHKSAKITGIISMLTLITLIILIITFFALSYYTDIILFKNILIVFISILSISVIFSFISFYLYNKIQNNKSI